jgi:hypothetical protein|eukprot:g1543.t1
MVRFKLKWQQGKLFQITKNMVEHGNIKKPLWMEAAERVPPLQRPAARPRRVIRFPYDYLAVDFEKRFPERAADAERVAMGQYDLMKNHGFRQHEALEKVLQRPGQSFDGKNWLTGTESIKLDKLRNASDVLDALKK